MGYRLTFYDCPKSVVEHLKNATDEDWQSDDYEKVAPYKQEGVKEMWYDCTMWLYFDSFIDLCNDGKEELIWSRFYKDKLEIEDDCSFNTMNKEQCLNFINMIKEHIFQQYSRETVSIEAEIELCDFIDGKISKEDLAKKYPKRYFKDKVIEQCDILEKARLSLVNACCDRNFFKFDYMNNDTFEKNMANPYMVSFGDSWKDVLANMIHVYKTFDWDNNIIYIHGC